MKKGYIVLFVVFIFLVGIILAIKNTQENPIQKERASQTKQRWIKETSPENLKVNDSDESILSNPYTGSFPTFIWMLVIGIVTFELLTKFLRR